MRVVKRRSYIRRRCYFDIFPDEEWVERVQRGIRINENGCWLWQGALNKYGYPRCWLYGRSHNVYLHRVLWMYRNGSFPNGTEADHLCHVRSCCNPDHIRAATDTEQRLNTINSYTRTKI